MEGIVRGEGCGGGGGKSANEGRFEGGMIDARRGGGGDFLSNGSELFPFDMFHFRDDLTHRRSFLKTKKPVYGSRSDKGSI